MITDDLEETYEIPEDWRSSQNPPGRRGVTWQGGNTETIKGVSKATFPESPGRLEHYNTLHR